MLESQSTKQIRL